MHRYAVTTLARVEATSDSEVLQAQPFDMVRILDADDVRSVVDLERLLPLIEDAFAKQYVGAVERPDRPHYSIGVGRGDDPERPTGTGLCMPAYVHGSPYVATKLATVFEGNADRGLATVTAQIALDDADTGLPVAYLDGTTITSARTGCIGGVGARALGPDGPVRLAVFGAGTQARWQTRAIDAATDLESVRIYAPSDSRERCAADLEGELEDVAVSAVASPAAALEGANVVVTATTSTEPVFDGDDLEPESLVVAVGAYTAEMRELDDRTIERAACVYADVPAEARGTGDLCHHSDLELEALGRVFATDEAVETASTVSTGSADVVVLSSVGTAVLDAVTAADVYDRARELGLGVDVSL